MEAEDYVRGEMDKGRTRAELMEEAHDALYHSERELRLLYHKRSHIDREVEKMDTKRRRAKRILHLLGEEE